MIPLSSPGTDGFVLPEPGDTLDFRMDDGAPIRAVRHGNPSGPRVVLSHGNGFASDSYFPFWRHMLERFDLVLFDVRNCGRNPFHAAEPHDYPRFARDNVAVHAAIRDAWGARTTVGVFHSMSAISALLAVIEDTWHWDALVLFDPPVAPPEGNPLRDQLLAEGALARNAARVRANRFSDPGELVDLYRSLPKFQRIRKGVAELNARSTLRHDPGFRRVAALLPRADGGRAVHRGGGAAHLGGGGPTVPSAAGRGLGPGAGRCAEDRALLRRVLRNPRHRIHLRARHHPPAAARGAGTVLRAARRLP